MKYTKKMEKLAEAWSAVKLSVRAYAREPSEVNAEKVTIARQRVEELKGGAAYGKSDFGVNTSGSKPEDPPRGPVNWGGPSAWPGPRGPRPG